MLGYAGWYSIKSYREFLFFIPFQQLFLIGPVFYFFTLSNLVKEFSFSLKHTLHFIPGLLYLIYSFIVFVTDKVILTEFYFYRDGKDKDLVFWYQMAGLISMSYYLILSFSKYRRYRSSIVNEVSFADEVLYKWIGRFIIAFLFIIILRLLFFILNPEWDEFGRKYWYYLCFSLLFFYIIIEGYKNIIITGFLRVPEYIDYKNKERKLQLPGESEVRDGVENLNIWKKRLTSLIEDEKLHTNPRLTLTDVAIELGTNRNTVSNIINHGLDMNFNDYINAKRVEDVIVKIQKKEYQEKSLLGIALDSGFNSKSTFNRAFKKHTSLTPKQFISKLKK